MSGTAPRAPSAAARAAAVLLLALFAAPAFAQHRARLSADLADHLAAGSQAIDVIVHGDQPAVDALASRYNLVVKRRMKSGGVLRVNAGQLDALQRDPDLDHLSGDIPLRPSMAITNAAIGADQVWAGDEAVPGFNGRGVTVAVIDSGISDRHAALRRRVIAAVDFTGGDGVDRYGHGTHVAAIIAGQAGRTVETRDLQGVAPGASLVSLRVLGDDGGGVISSVIEAIDWAIEHKAQYRIGVINLSLGAPVLQPYRDDPMCEAVERAVRAGIVVVAAAGNVGRSRSGRSLAGGITTPGNDPYVITAGAIDTNGTPERSDDVVAPYSSRGPTMYDLVMKPDVLAPGSHIVSAEAAGSVAAREHPDRHVTGSGANGYIQFSGTSMATGVVSGAVALLLQSDPHLTPANVKAVLQLTSSFIRSSNPFDQGAGSLNALAAVGFAAGGYAELPVTSIADERVAANGVVAAAPGFDRGVSAAAIPEPDAPAIVWDSGIGAANISD